MKSLNVIIMAIAILLLLASPSHADGNKLLKQCLAAESYIDTNEVVNEFDIPYCMGLVNGVFGTMVAMSSDKIPIRICPPTNGINGGQMVRIVTSYLRNNPAKLHVDEVVLIMAAYVGAFPCK